MIRTASWRFLAACVLPLLLASAAHAQVAYVAATWDDNSIHLLGANLNSLSSFPAGAGSPNGVVSDGSLIYSGHFDGAQVIAYNMAGVEQFRWSDPRLANVQGMAFVGSELAVVYDPVDDEAISFFNPTTGAYLRSIVNGQGDDVEALAYDGTLLWALGAEIHGLDPADGSVVASIPNAAISEQFGGTAMAYGGGNTLILGGSSGNWFRVSTVDGSVVDSGSNSLNMFGLSEINPIPEPASGALGMASIAVWGAFLRRRRFARA